MKDGVRWLATILSAIGLIYVSCDMPGSTTPRTRHLASGGRSTPVPHIRDKWALLIGVDKFQDPAVAANHEAAFNVQALAKILENPNAGKFLPSHVQILSGRSATATGINDVVENWLAKKALPDDLIFVYVSSVMNSNEHRDPLLFSYDTLGSESELSGINLREFLIELRRRTQSRLIVCALDTSPAPGSKGVDLELLADTGVAVLSATDGHQRSLNNGVTGSSVFIHHLGEAISLDGGHFNLEQVFDHVSHNVSNDAEIAFKTHQTPLLIVADKTIAQNLELGAPPRASTVHQTISFGHPMDRLALDHPEIIPPLLGIPGQTVSVKQKAPSHQLELAGAGGTKEKSKDQDEDDEDAPHQHVDYGPYIDKMKADVRKHWSPPKGLENRRVVAVFTIMKDGRVIDAHVVDSSGIPEVDQSALDALKAASPLDPLPPGAPASVDMKYKFEWQIKRD